MSHTGNVTGNYSGNFSGHGSANYSKNDLWSPIELSLTLWLDAADVSTISASSNLVTEWRDKSGNRRNATTTVRSPSFTQVVTTNGLSGITFTGASATKLDTPDFAIAPNRQFCTFAIVSGGGLISSSDYPRIWLAKGNGDSSGAGTTYQQGFLGAGSANGTAAFIAGALSPLTPQISGISTTTLPVLLSGRFGTAGLATDNISLSVNGYSQVVESGGRTGALSATGIRIGADTGTGSSGGWNSWMGEIILTQNISFFQSQLVEGYLAWKWRNPLVASHPFANRPPLIGD